MLFRYLALFALVAGLAACVAPRTSGTRDTTSALVTRPLKLASWNLEFLAEKDGAGCEPRTAADYQAMRDIVDDLGADVIAFQEVENEAAAARVFNPARYVIVIEARLGAASGSCGGRNSGQQFIRQAVGFAIRKGISFDRNPDLTALMLGNPQLRSGADITLFPAGQSPIRLLAIHLKSGCFQGATADACPTLLQQIPVVESWIDNAASGPVRFAVLGDWNRRLGVQGDAFWTEIDDGDPPNSDLRLGDEGVGPSCDPRFTTFIDHIVMDKRAGVDMMSFAETHYPTGGKHYSDHCPIAVTLAR